MPAPRKPKKALIQFAVALVIAVVVGIGAIALTVSVLQANSKVVADKQAEIADKEKELERKMAQLKAQAEKQQVTVSFKTVKAVSDIMPGQPITKEMLLEETTDMRPEPGMVTMLRQAVGKMVRNPVSAGEPISQSMLLDTGGFINVKDGQRAITIQVDNVGGLGGAIAPGVHVDVLTTITASEESSSKKMITKTLLQDIVVLASPNSAPPPAGGPGIDPKAPAPSSMPGGLVTLAVSPRQAEMLTLANQMGKFHLTLRSFTDKRTAKVNGMDTATLVSGIDGEKLKKNLPKPPEPSHDGFVPVSFTPDAALPNPMNAGGLKSRFSMEIYKGAASEKVEFER